MLHHHRSRDFLIGAAMGGLLGTLGALLLAPKSGKKLRQDLCDNCSEMTDKAHDIADRLCKKGKCLSSQTYDWAGKTKDIINEVTDGVKSWVCPGEEEEETSIDLLTGGVAGAILGATAGLLLAPKSGEQLREGMADTYQDISKKGKKFIKGARSQASDWVDLAKDVVDNIADTIQEKGEEFIEKGERSLHTSHLNEVIDWASLGVRLWKSIKNRR